MYQFSTLGPQTPTMSTSRQEWNYSKQTEHPSSWLPNYWQFWNWNWLRNPSRWEKEKAGKVGVSRKWSLSPRKRFHTSPASCQSTLLQRQGSDGEHEWPGLGLLSYTELMLYLNRILRLGPGKADWGFGRMGEDAIGSLCLSPHEVTLDKCPVFHYCLLNWPIEDLWPSLAYKLSELRLWS